MAIDSASKRYSAISVLLPFRASMPIPDGTISAADRQHGALMYSGVLAQSAAAGTGTPLEAGMKVGGITTVGGYGSW